MVESAKRSTINMNLNLWKLFLKLYQRNQNVKGKVGGVIQAYVEYLSEKNETREKESDFNFDDYRRIDVEEKKYEEPTK